MGSSDIIFLLGPSGVGKSQLATWMEEDFSFLKIEIDQYSPGGKGIDGAGLRSEWDTFHDKGIVSPIAETLRGRISKGGFRGAVIALPSGNVFPSSHIEAAASEGMAIFILYGSLGECRDAFLQREKALDRGFDNIEHWNRNNLRSHGEFSKPEFSEARILVFKGGVRRSRAELIEDVRRRITGVAQLRIP